MLPNSPTLMTTLTTTSNHPTQNLTGSVLTGRPRSILQPVAIMNFPESLSGYGNLFDPPLREYDGRELVRSITRGCKNRDASELRACILYLTRQHPTVIIHQGEHGSDHHSIAKPTEVATRVAQELMLIASDIDNVLNLDIE